MPWLKVSQQLFLNFSTACISFFLLLYFLAGLCDSPLAPADCSASEWSSNIKTLNMLPELIKMACTAYGAWGNATVNNGHGGLTQVRALDFGTGPFPNYTVVQVHRNDPNSGELMLWFGPVFDSLILILFILPSMDISIILT